jgi:hypothetical protein
MTAGLWQHFQRHCSVVIVRRAAIGKCELAIENEVRRFGCRFASASCPNILHLGGAELDSLPVAQFMETIGREQNAVSWASCTTGRS